MALQWCTSHGLQISEGGGDKFKWGNFGRNLSVRSKRFSFLQSLLHRKDFPLFVCPFYILFLLWIMEVFLISTDVKHSEIILKNKRLRKRRTRKEQLLIYSFAVFLLTMTLSGRPGYIPKHCLTNRMIVFLMPLLAPWHFFLVGQTQVFLDYPRIVPFLESASTAATHGFISALNFWVPKCFILFPWESPVWGVSSLSPFYFEHRTVAFLSSTFVRPIRHLFSVSFPVSSVRDWCQGSGFFPGHRVQRGTS